MRVGVGEDSRVSRNGFLRRVAAAAAVGALGAPLFPGGTDPAVAQDLEVSLATWALGTLGSHAKSYAGDQLWGGVMDALGLGGGGGDPQLAQISAQLSTINQTLVTIEDNLTALKQQLNIAQNTITTHISEEPFKRHVNALNRLFGSADDQDTLSLGALINAARNGETVERTAFVQRIDATVQEHIDGIHDTMATTVAGDVSLLQQWADLLISQLHNPQGQPNIDGLPRAYALLESYFLQGLGAQLKGVALRAARFGLQPGTDAVAATARARAGFVATYRFEADRFVWATERLVFALASMQSMSDMMYGPIVILRRVDVLTNGMAALLAGQGDTLEALFGGTYGRIVCRAADRIEPSRPGFVLIDGREYAGAVPAHASGVAWADFAPTDGSYPKLLAPEDSQVRIVRSRTAFMPYPRLSQSLTPDDPRTTPAHGMVDVATFESTFTATPTAVHAAGFVDTTHLRLYEPLPAASHTIDRSDQGLSSQVVDMAQRGLGSFPASVSSVSQAVLVNAEFQGGSLQPVLKQTFRQPLFIAPTDEQLTVFVHGYFFVTLVQAFDTMPEINEGITLTLQGSDGSSVALADSTGSPADVWQRANGFSASAPLASRPSIVTKPNVKYDLVSTYTTSARTGQDRSAINERLSLNLEVAIVRPPLSSF